jgi:hypothetical protein
MRRPSFVNGRRRGGGRLESDFPIAHINEQGFNLFIVPLDPSLNTLFNGLLMKMRAGAENHHVVHPNLPNH